MPFDLSDWNSIPTARCTRHQHPHPTIAIIERYADIVAGRIVVCSPLFWLALFLAYAAVSLGIIS